MNSGVIVTGANGFIGSNFINKIKKESLIFVDKSNLSFRDFSNEKVNDLEKKFSKIYLFHLATYYSKSTNDKEKIYDANILFGKKLLDKLDSVNLHKIVYTNTMFNFYKDQNLRNLYYTNTKLEFTKLIERSINKKQTYLEEIYLDNTFGIGDERKKIINLVLDSVKNNQPSPIENEETYINLVHVNYVIERLFLAIKRNNERKSAFVAYNMVNLLSIYNFLKHYKEKGKVEKSLLRYSENEYLDSSPDIIYENIKIPDLSSELINLYDDYVL